MFADVSPGQATAQTHALPRGPRVSLRRVCIRDLDGIRDLAERQGVLTEELELARLVRADPQSWLVVCATAHVGATETVLGLGMIEIGDSAATVPSLLLVDAQATEGLAALLAGALVGHARTLAGSQVA